MSGPASGVVLRPTLSRLAQPAEAPERYYVADPECQLVADPIRRANVRFRSGGVTLAGHRYRPPGVRGRIAGDRRWLARCCRRRWSLAAAARRDASRAG